MGMRTRCWIVGAAVLSGCASGRAGFWVHRQDYVAVVELARAQAPPPGVLAEWVVDDLDHPEALRAVEDADRFRGAGRGRVWATTTAGGALSVFIETVDRGHAGEHGYAFIEPGGAAWDPDRDGERWFIVGELGGGWHLIAFDLG